MCGSLTAAESLQMYSNIVVLTLKVVCDDMACLHKCFFMALNIRCSNASMVVHVFSVVLGSGIVAIRIYLTQASLAISYTVMHLNKIFVIFIAHLQNLFQHLG